MKQFLTLLLLLFFSLSSTLSAQENDTISGYRMYMRAKTLMESGYYSRAIQTIDSLSDLWKADATVQMTKGICYEELGDNKKAIECYNLSIASNPGFNISRINRGVLYVKSQRYRKGMDDLSFILKLDSTNLYAQAFAIDAYFALSKPDSAVICLRYLLKRSAYVKDQIPLSALHFNMSRYYALKNSLPNAIRYADSSIACDSLYSDAYYMKAGCLFDMNEPQKALKAINKCIPLNVYDGEAYYLKAQILGRLLRQDDACVVLKKGAEMKNLNCIRLYNRWCGAKNQYPEPIVKDSAYGTRHFTIPPPPPPRPK